MELFFLAALTRVCRPRHIFEIGTYEGRTANIFALHSNDACRIETLDLPHEKEQEAAFEIADYDKKWFVKTDTRIGGRLGALRRPGANERITQHLGDSATFDYSPWHRRIDLTLVDGAHNYPYVKSDCRNALKMRAPRGIIVMHDYTTHDDVTLVATQLAQTHRVFHVTQSAFAIVLPTQRRGRGARP